MVSARTAAMVLNRIIDLKIDAQNPRTKDRPSVTGQISAKVSWMVAGVSLAIFFLSAYFLNALCFKLSFVALVFLVGYHSVKRFSFLSHWVLGLVLAMAPMGGWIAVTGAFSWIPVPLAFAVLLWVAGFDIIYSLQDLDFDRANKLHSVPVRFGIGGALRIARICHIATVVLLGFFGVIAGLGWVYWAGVCVTAVLLKVEHNFVSEDDLSNINAAFFTVNGWVGVLLFVFTLLEIL